MMRVLLTLALVAGHVVAGRCVAIDGDRILARDLATVAPAFAKIAGDTMVGFAPAAGVRRTFSEAEVARMARSAGVQAETASSICIERVSQRLTEPQLRSAMEVALAGQDVRIEIVDFSRYPLPEGAIEFDLSSLPEPSGVRPDAPVIWRGRLRYDRTRSATVWARVRISRRGSWVEAAAPVNPRQEVRPDQLVLRSGQLYGLGSARVTSIDAVAGKRLTRSVRPGDPITRDMIVERREVEPGDMVDVAVKSGAAALRFSVRAETGGRLHEKIFVAAPAGGKRLSAVVVAKGRVQIDVAQ